MSLSIDYRKHTLQFRFEARTSRGPLTSRETYYIRIGEKNQTRLHGWGEASPLRGLSPDDRPDFEEKLQNLLQTMQGIPLQADQDWLLSFAEEFVPDNLPSLRFALETAFLDWLHGGQKHIYPGKFTQGKKSLLINGLIWMGDLDFMQAQMEEKIKQGFRCIKMKIGALDFQQELSLLAKVRERYTPEEITLRVDANGAFSPQDALIKLEQLAPLHIHSIEQPIAAGEPEELAKLCQQSPIPIALDEELIGISTYELKKDLLHTVQPQYIILKPTLLGGFQASKEWIEIAESLQIAWWITSALESNVGLNAIAQFTDQFNNPLPQGLGTGGLYHNNIASPLRIQGELLQYDLQGSWEKIF